MGLQLFNLLFLTGVFPLVLSVPLNYYLILQDKTWPEAQAYCRANHVDLVTIETNADIVHLQTEAWNHHFTSSAWIGLWNDINSWRWSMDNDPLGSYENWASGFGMFSQQPNNYGGNETCGRISRNDWSDTECTQLFPFMCFDEHQTGTARYVYYPALKTWPEAQTFCRQFHTDLASARNSSENTIIQNILISHAVTYPGIMDTWFGLFRDSWKWSDQTNVSTIAWMPGEPDNAQGDEDCGFVYNGLAADGPCSDKKPFFCYSEITGQKQIIRMTFQSDQDVNTPKLKVAVMKQIEKKLKSHGMKNITVIWKQK